MDSPDIEIPQIDIPEFSSIDSETFKKDIVIPYFKDIYKVSLEPKLTHVGSLSKIRQER